VTEDRVRPRPFLKWAGGKRQLLPFLRRFCPAQFGTYYEPFLGSGALFFDLTRRGLLQGRRAVLIDRNADLIGCYLRVRDQVDRVVAVLADLAAGHRRAPKRHYYAIRDGRFNPLRRAIWGPRGPDPARYTAELAAMLVYLNRTGYNGLFRLNRAGEFNVPMGRYRRPRICDAPTLVSASRALAAPGVELRHASFDCVLDEAQAGDFLYFDPPYAPLSPTASFTAYTAGGFSAADHARLHQVVVELARRGCRVLLTNSSAPLVRRLYEQDAEARRAGLRTFTVAARRAINSNAAGRGGVTELLVSNVDPAELSGRRP
jgi:DNA adenine methylase